MSGVLLLFPIYTFIVFKGIILQSFSVLLIYEEGVGGEESGVQTNVPRLTCNSVVVL